jgi:hypothetical protein
MASNNLTNYLHPPIIAVWVDQNIGEEGAYSQIKQRFVQLSPLIKEWKFFVNPEDFYNFLDDNPKNQIFLIMSGQTAQKIIPAKHTYVNIHSMYVYCHDVNRHRRLKSQFNKVKDVMNLEDDLYKKIADELSLLLIDIGEFYVESQDRSLARNTLEEALRLIRDTLHLENNHGRISKANDLLHKLDTWNENVLYF